jgi:uncharacterized membrane protein YdjX (TVP38/TMEM64 family)
VTRRSADNGSPNWSFWRTAFIIISTIALGGALWRWRAPLWAFFGDQARLQTWVMRFGPWGPLVSIGLNVAQVLLAPIPGQFLGLMNGYLYGVWRGAAYSMVGLFIGTALAMGIGRRLGRPVVEQMVRPAHLARWDRIAHDQGPLFFFLVFLLPFVPDDLASFLIGLSPLSIPPMLVLATLGRLPGVFVSCWIGANAALLPWWAWGVLGGGAAALAWLFWQRQTQLEDFTLRLIRSVQRRFR